MVNCCEHCANYIYDDEAGCYFCDAALDEDEMVRFLSSNMRGCNYYSDDDDYKIVKKQN